MKTISVIGGGFAGLTLTLKLCQRGFHVDLYEASPRLGGLLGTDFTEHGLAERAANSLIRTERVEALFKELDLTPLPSSEFAKKRFLYREKICSWPLSPFETFSLCFRLIPKIFKGKMAFKPNPQETLQAWGERLIGPAATQYILEPALQGIYGGELSRLSAHLILTPLLMKKKTNKYKGLLSAPLGMQDLVDHLEKKIKTLDVNLHLNTSADLRQLQGPLIIATSAKSASKILSSTHPQVTQILDRIHMLSLLSVTLFFDKPQALFKGFGCLIPRISNFKSLGFLMNPYIFPSRHTTYNETWILGGQENDLLNFSDQEILSLIEKERSQILNLHEKTNIVDYRINRWEKALPYYDLQLEKALEDLPRSLPKSIMLHGNYLEGIGLSRILERSESIAEKMESLIT